MTISRFIIICIVCVWLLVPFALGQATLQGGDGECSVDGECEDGDFCTTDVCEAGECLQTTSCGPPVQDGCVLRNVCDEEANQCISQPDDSLCNDDLFCNGQEFCNPEDGQCQPGLICPAQIDGCRVYGACDEDIDECIVELDSTFCEDGAFCNPNGECQLVGEGVPTLSEWGLLALTVSLLGLGILRLGSSRSLSA